MRHKTLWLVIFWLIVALGGIVTVFFGGQVPLATLIGFVGAVSLAYVGVSKTITLVDAARSPFLLPYTQPLQDKHLWVVITWLVLFILLLLLAALKPSVGSPIEIGLIFAGTLSTAYIGLDKGIKVASVAKEEEPQQ